MKNRTSKLVAASALVLMFLAAAFVALVAAPEPAQAGIRFCCTPQQASACAAQGGTATCRNNVCQCLF